MKLYMSNIIIAFVLVGAYILSLSSSLYDGLQDHDLIATILSLVNAESIFSLTFILMVIGSGSFINSKIWPWITTTVYNDVVSLFRQMQENRHEIERGEMEHIRVLTKQIRDVTDSYSANTTRITELSVQMTQVDNAVGGLAALITRKLDKMDDRITENRPCLYEKKRDL